MKILALSAKLNQILYTYSVGPKRLEIQKLTTQNGGGEAKMKILALSTKLCNSWLSLVDRARIFIFDPPPFFCLIGIMFKTHLKNIHILCSFQKYIHFFSS